MNSICGIHKHYNPECQMCRAKPASGPVPLSPEEQRVMHSALMQGVNVVDAKPASETPMDMTGIEEELRYQRFLAQACKEDAQRFKGERDALARQNAALREALQRIVGRGPYSVNGGMACATCTAFWHSDPDVIKFQSEHHYERCAYVIARAALSAALSDE